MVKNWSKITFPCESCEEYTSSQYLHFQTQSRTAHSNKTSSKYFANGLNSINTETIVSTNNSSKQPTQEKIQISLFQVLAWLYLISRGQMVSQPDIIQKQDPAVFCFSPALMDLLQLAKEMKSKPSAWAWPDKVQPKDSNILPSSETVCSHLYSLDFKFII